MRTLIVLVTAVAAGLALWRFGADPLWAIVLAVPPAALALVATYLPKATDVVWLPPPEPPSSIASVQASTLATRLAQAAGDETRFRERVQPRLRKLGIETNVLPEPHELAEMLRRVE
ncbi:hypothetical protein Lesp02_67310 [Lentzea sp. NBRC 105346]|uniref:hypothetical protein n=1 Tax=Lentzea sp. NBRC 105346 TaxID=3032205 RepID=UPI0024A3268A|nr:hypothetical protein [Lentzea sp. NBRC 105346]GLZ34544.1 hypothetical protein Lesp02_67310 [Lentzea sp. NBRC 105346]